LDKANGHQPPISPVRGHGDQQPENRINQHANPKEVFGAITLSKYTERYLRNNIAPEERAQEIALLFIIPQKGSIGVLQGRKFIRLRVFSSSFLSLNSHIFLWVEKELHNFMYLLQLWFH